MFRRNTYFIVIIAVLVSIAVSMLFGSKDDATIPLTGTVMSSLEIYQEMYYDDDCNPQQNNCPEGSYCRYLWTIGKPINTNKFRCIRNCYQCDCGIRQVSGNHSCSYYGLQDFKDEQECKDIIGGVCPEGYDNAWCGDGNIDYPYEMCDPKEDNNCCPAGSSLCDSKDDCECKSTYKMKSGKCQCLYPAPYEASVPFSDPKGAEHCVQCLEDKDCTQRGPDYTCSDYGVCVEEGGEGGNIGVEIGGGVEGGGGGGLTGGDIGNVGTIGGDDGGLLGGAQSGDSGGNGEGGETDNGGDDGGDSDSSSANSVSSFLVMSNSSSAISVSSVSSTESSSQSEDENSSSSAESSEEESSSSNKQSQFSSASVVFSSVGFSESETYSEYSSIASFAFSSDEFSSQKIESSSIESSTAQSSTVSSSSNGPVCGDGIVEGEEECDNGSICSQNPSIECTKNSDCRQCMLIEGLGRCGSDIDGKICFAHEQCEEEQYFCVYDIFNTSCDANCHITESSSSSSESIVISESSDSSESSIEEQVSSSSKKSSVSSSSEVSSSASSKKSLVALSSEASSEGGKTDGTDDDDDGSTTGGTGGGASSKPDTLLAGIYCGNGFIDRNEQCDDGNRINGDGCSETCTQELFALPIITKDEVVNPVILPKLIEQPLVAAASICGNGVLEASEECDDANRRDNDGCSSTCLLEIGICGDGIVQTLLGEQCEASRHNDSLGYACLNCRFASSLCGDGQIDAGEECDVGTQNSTTPDATCRPDCSLSRCGDAITDTAEQCDDGNRNNNDGCDRYCRIEEVEKKAQEETLVAAEFTESDTGVSVAQQFQFPQIPTSQPIPYQLPYAQLQPLIQTQGPVGDTGPAAAAAIGVGSAAGISWMRRKRRKGKY